MSWLELDDRILEHPKFIRAVKISGSEAIHMWLGIRAYCGQHLSNGIVPSDMLSEVRGPTDPEKRASALSALYTVGLLEEHKKGAKMHDYLEWSSSREDVLSRREKARARKARSRRDSHSDSTSDSKRDSRSDSACGSDAVTNPSSSPPTSTKEKKKSDAARLVFDAWREDTGHERSVFDERRKALIAKRLKEGFSPETLITAIKNRRHSTWLMGTDPKNSTLYDQIETLLKSAAQVERLVKLGEGADVQETIQWPG